MADDHPCPLCGNSFDTEHKLKEHTRQHHGQEA